jgi:kumamolisin
VASLANGQEGAAPGALSHVPRAVGHGQRIGPVPRQGDLSVTLVLTPRDAKGLVAKAQGAIGYRRADVDVVHRPDGATQRRVVAWCADHGLEASASEDGYLVEARGAVADIEATFGTRVDTHVVGRVRGRAIRTEPVLPAHLQGDVVAVLGLSDLARPWCVRPRRPGGATGASGPASGGGYMPAEIRRAYGLPDPADGLDGRGEVAVVFEFGSAYTESDLGAFWQQARVSAPQVSTVWALGPGQEMPPQPPLSADLEATTDVEWLGGLAPGAQVVVVNAQAGATTGSFTQALARAVVAALALEPTPAVISISYGDAEAFFGAAELKALDLLFARAAARGVSVLAASGDSGAYGVPVPVGALESVDAPACLTHVLAVGGTHLELNDGVVARELGWSDSGGTGASGGGVSAVFEASPWQDPEQVAAATGGLSGRGVPDVCANADPLTGYRVVLDDHVDVVGGTSVAAPVWAAGLTIVAQARRQAGLTPLGLAARAVYPLWSRPTRIRDILVGDNAFLSAAGYRCRTGWDAVTGVGAPAGVGLWEELSRVGPQAPPPESRLRGPSAHAAEPPSVEEIDMDEEDPPEPPPEASEGAGRVLVEAKAWPAQPSAPDEREAPLPAALDVDASRPWPAPPASDAGPRVRPVIVAKASLVPPPTAATPDAQALESAPERDREEAREGAGAKRAPEPPPSPGPSADAAGPGRSVVVAKASLVLPSAPAVPSAHAAEAASPEGPGPQVDAAGGAPSNSQAIAATAPPANQARADATPSAAPVRAKRAAGSSNTRRVPATSASCTGRRRRGPG